jgi:hypothetical protein
MISAIRAAGLLWLLASPTYSPAAEDQTLEYRVKAAFLLNFTKFVEWPPSAFANDKSPVSICILGEDPFGQVMDDIVGDESVNSRKLVVRRLRDIPAAGACQVLFFEKDDKDIPRVLAKVGAGVLTVGQGGNFMRDGGIIAFVIENRRVRFDINQSAAAKAELKMNAKLLSVARSVER